VYAVGERLFTFWHYGGERRRCGPLDVCEGAGLLTCSGEVWDAGLPVGLTEPDHLR
jgi:hypothetical protein